MLIRPSRIFPLGEHALTVEFGNDLSTELNNVAVELAAYFNEHPFPGFIEAVPAIASTTIFYDSTSVRGQRGVKSAYGFVQDLVNRSLENIRVRDHLPERKLSIPVSFGADHSPDLSAVAEFAGLPPEEVIRIFLSGTYRVFMIGFLPGFAYLGIVDDRIAMPRREVPRLKVPKGSVGIAGRQTGIYPSASPGGWQLIGRSDVELLGTRYGSPGLFQPGDEVTFYRT